METSKAGTSTGISAGTSTGTSTVLSTHLGIECASGIVFYQLVSLYCKFHFALLFEPLSSCTKILLLLKCMRIFGTLYNIVSS